MNDTNVRSAVITGAYKGIGKCIALRLAKDGFNIIINYRNKNKKAEAEATAEECRRYNVKAEIFQADVSVEDNCKALVDFANEKFGSVDVLVNNAGVVSYGLLTRVKEEEYRRVISCDQDSAFFMMKHAAKSMSKNKYGRIINISSMAGIRGFSGGLVYSAAKGAVISMTKAAAKELSGKNITVNAVAPGMVNTDMNGIVSEEQNKRVTKNIGMGRYGLPEEVAGAVAYFASDEAAYTTGAVIEIHGSMES